MKLTTDARPAQKVKSGMDLMTMTDACLTLKVSRRTVYRMIRDGVLPVPKTMGNFRQAYFERADFEKACRKGLR